jgi:hypothetical protein
MNCLKAAVQLHLKLQIQRKVSSHRNAEPGQPDWSLGTQPRVTMHFREKLKRFAMFNPKGLNSRCASETSLTSASRRAGTQ